MTRALLAAFAIIAAAPAFAFCIKPSAPHCASGYGSFDSEREFDFCKRDMDSHPFQLQDYAQCVDAMRDYRDAVDSFNRRGRD